MLRMLACLSTLVPMAGLAVAGLGEQLAWASTSVSGASDSTSPLVIDPSSAPTDARTVTLGPVSQPVAFIVRMPATKTINRVTLGNVGTGAGSCLPRAQASLSIQNRIGGDLGAQGTLTASSVAAVTLPSSPGKATWSVPPTMLTAGDSYVFLVGPGDAQGCSRISLRSWAHNSAVVESGSATCASGPAPEDGGAGTYYRMWHVTGIDDRDPLRNCAWNFFVSSMPTGWLETDLQNVFAITGFTGAPGFEPSVREVCNSPYSDLPAKYGVRVALWRQTGGGSDWVCQWPQYAPPGQTVTDGWYYGLPWLAARSGAPRDVYLKLSLDEPALARWYRPNLAFDSSEKWRPLDVDRFFGERDPSDGQPYHRVCNVTCIPLASAASLGAPYNTDASYIDIHGSGSESSYTSPYPACQVAGLRDCDTGSNSAIYYHVSPPSPGAYRYIDYWLFYRYNYFSSVLGWNHEGDWESITLAPSRDRPGTFDFASFSQHGTWYNYLRPILECDSGGYASCGQETARGGARVWSRPANGSHANYPFRCSESVPYTCVQDDGVSLERGHDGANPWGRNDAVAALLAMPNIGSAGWIDWHGTWGDPAEGGPIRGPAVDGNGEHFSAPWSSQCATDNASCARESRGRDRQIPDLAHESPARRATPHCGSWFGAGIVALVCRPYTLDRAAKTARVGGHSNVRLYRIVNAAVRAAGRQGTVPERRAATRPLVQLSGPGLVPGEGLMISGSDARNAHLYVRVRDGSRTVIASFAHVRLGRRGIARVRVRARSRGRVRVDLVPSTGPLLRPSRLWTLRTVRSRHPEHIGLRQHG